MYQEQPYAQVDGKGRLEFSPELSSRYGIKQGERINFSEGSGVLSLYCPSHLAKLYIEPTNQCNLDCVTCIRNNWDEPAGKMSREVFNAIIGGIKYFSPPPAIVFGGFGEPLLHPDIATMVAEAKALGSRVEIITNATMLTSDLSHELIRAGLDMLWVSIDGATPESYADIRLGAKLPLVLENLRSFHDFICAGADFMGVVPHTGLGICFVAMKRNIADLPAVIDIGLKFNAERFMVSNVLPYSREMIEEALYYRVLSNSSDKHLNLPKIDINEATLGPIYSAISRLSRPIASINSDHPRNQCPFIAAGSGAINWEGNMSPCLPLMHNHTSYLGYLQYEERFSRKWVIGNIMHSNLKELWNKQEHLSFRERIQSFDFAPCTGCSGCELSEKNEEDCIGSSFPTCGGCLWAQGVIQCP